MMSQRILNAIRATLLDQATLQLSSSGTTKLTATPADIIKEYPPSTMGKLVSEILSIFQDMASYTPHPIKEAFNNYTRDKSQAELCFVCAIVIAVVVFVIVLPALEAILRREEGCGDEEELTTEEEILRYYYFTQQREGDESSSSSEKHQTMRVYTPGVGVVQMSMEELLRECSSSSCSGSSTGTSGSMETIYEEEEEEEHEAYDLPSPTSSPPVTPPPPEIRRSDAYSRMVDEELKKRLFHDDETRPPLSTNHAPQ
mmetsp:Transcript_12417/g.18525  ORF Transcript_12417/g.18525 Transcript_12417/m.18525 type:complete len:257 (-) Transcript_12417:130-900(-)